MVVVLVSAPPTLFVKLHPGYVVPYALDLPARQRGTEHGQVCLPAGAGEGGHHVLLLTGGISDAQDLRHIQTLQDSCEQRPPASRFLLPS